MKGEFSPRVLNCDIPTCSLIKEKKGLISLVIFSVPEWQGQHLPSFKHGLFKRKVCVFQTKHKPAVCSVPHVLCSRSLRMQVAPWNNVRGPQSTQQSRGCRLKSWQGLHHCCRWKQQLQIWDSCSVPHGCTSMHWKSREYICPMQTHSVQTGSFCDIQGLQIPEISDSYSDNQCQQELFFCFTGGHKAAQQEDKSEQTLM